MYRLLCVELLLADLLPGLAGGLGGGGVLQEGQEDVIRVGPLLFGLTSNKDDSRELKPLTSLL